MTITIPTIDPLSTTGRLVEIGIVIVGVLALWLVYRAARRTRRVGDEGRHAAPTATRVYYTAAGLGMALSLDTSYRFFQDVLRITGVEQVGMFSVTDVALIACAVGMRANVRRVDPKTGRAGTPGAPRLVAWLLCAGASYAALVEAGLVAGLARIAFGPLLAMVMLHLALGLEIRHRGARSGGMWARLVAELRERLLSRFGVGDEHRSAAKRTKDRALRRYVRLVAIEHPRFPAWRNFRAARAARVAEVYSPAQLTAFLKQLAVAQNALNVPSLAAPWLTTTPDPKTPGPASTAPMPAITDMPPAAQDDPNVVSFMLTDVRPDWLTGGMTAKDAIEGWLDRHGDPGRGGGALITKWAQQWFDVNKDYGRNVLNEWRRKQFDNRATGTTATGGE